MFDINNLYIKAKNDLNLQNGVVIPAGTECFARKLGVDRYSILYRGKEYDVMATGKKISLELIKIFFDIMHTDDSRKCLDVDLSELAKKNLHSSFDVNVIQRLKSDAKLITDSIILTIESDVFKDKNGKSLYGSVSKLEVDLSCCELVDITENTICSNKTSSPYAIKRYIVLIKYNLEYFYIVLNSVYLELEFIEQDSYGLVKRKTNMLTNMRITAYTTLSKEPLYFKDTILYRKVFNKKGKECLLNDEEILKKISSISKDIYDLDPLGNFFKKSGN